MTEDSVETFLKEAEPLPESNRYVVGAFGTGITIYEQQVRALNLIYSIHTEDRIKPGSNIAIIGGGVSGVTATTAAAALGYKAYLFERRPSLLHLQHGCDTRWLHPHLYNWPAYGAENPYAGLPLLSWRKGTAAQVVEQLLVGFNQGLDALRERIKLHIGASVKFPAPLRVSWENSQSSPKRGEKPFAAVIFAVGFGVETGVMDGKTTSYWRNDSLNQLRPGPSATRKSKFLVSGTGDGGLIDLLRTRIASFNQGRILQEFIQPEDIALVSRLRKIDADWDKVEHPENCTWLYDRYSQMRDDGLTDALTRRVKDRVRTDSEATLNGRAETVSHALRLDRASLFNTLLVHQLDELGEFQYISGECRIKSRSTATIGETKIEVDQIIIRHGTNRKEVLRSAGCSEAIRLVPEELGTRRLGTPQRLWPAGWWKVEGGSFLPSERVEFVPPATVAIATTFVSTLSDVIQLHQRRIADSQFRITLHRLIRVNEAEFFQQIARYAGTRIAGRVGRIFDISGGLVGLACRLGKPVIVTRDADFDEIWAGLHLGDAGARPVDSRVKSLLACPFFTPTKKGRKPHVSLVLFMDSAQANFFTTEVLKTVYAACKGFVQNLDTMQKNKEASFSSTDYLGYGPTIPVKDRRFVGKYPGLKTDHKIFRNYAKDLTFKRVKSFEVDLNL